MNESRAEIAQAIRAALDRAPLERDVVEFASRRISLPVGAGPIAGPYRFERFPPIEQVVRDMAHDSPVRQVTVQKAAQLGLTIAAAVAMAHRFATREGPGWATFFLPRTGKDLTLYATSKVRVIMEACEPLRGLLGQTRLEGGTEGKGVEQAAITTVPGGGFVISGAGGVGGMRSRTLTMAIVDDYDGCPAGKEGAILDLARGRLEAMNDHNAKLIVLSSPGSYPSPICQEYERGTCSEWWVPCHNCGVFETWKPENFVWQDEDDVHFRCASCSAKILQHHIPGMNSEGEWRARNRRMLGKHHSYYLWQGQVPSTLVSWAGYARAFRNAWDAFRGRTDEGFSEESLRACTNTKNGLPYEDSAKRKLSGEQRAVYQQREEPWDIATLPLVAITAGTDVNGKWLETTVRGWGIGRESWVLDVVQHRVQAGEGLESDALWNRWWSYIVQAGAVGVCVDGASYTTTVRDQVTRLLQDVVEVRDGGGLLIETMAGSVRSKIGLWAIQGNVRIARRSIWPSAEAPEPGALDSKGELQLVQVQVNEAKSRVRLALARFADPDEPRSGPGRLHVSSARGRDWIRQMYSEEEKGGKWVKRPGGGRNEALDTIGYTEAALDAVLALTPGLAQRLRGVTAEESRLVAPQAKNAPPPPPTLDPAALVRW